MSSIILIAGIILLFIIRLRLVLVRQFDPDEFAYLHWAWLTFKGQIPYRDYFFYATPIFLWPLVILFLLPEGPIIAVLGRLFMAAIFGLLLLVEYHTVKHITGKKTVALLSVLILSAFPMTLDKTIEIRPDVLMMVLFLTSYLLITRKRYLLAGLVTGINSLMFMKILILLPALIPLLFTHTANIKKHVMKFALGGSIAAGGFFLYLLANNIVWLCFWSLTRISQYVNNTQWGFPPLTGLMPYPYVYLTEGGISYPWIINTVLLALAVPGIPIVFVRTRNHPSRFFFTVLFVLLSMALFFLFPRPHMQYFIPLTVVASLLAALTVGETLAFTSSRLRLPVLEPVGIALVLLGLSVSMYMQTMDRIRPGNTNEEQLQVLTDTSRIIKPHETVYDEVGSYIFRPDGYFICCHHYEQFVDKLDPSLHSLKSHLIGNKTKFIVLDQKGFAFWTPKPDDLEFIITHYAPSKYRKIYTLGYRFRCNGGSCVQLNVHGGAISDQPVNAFPVVIAESYRIRISPPDATVAINGTARNNNEIIALPVASYRFSASASVTDFSVQLER